MPHKKTERRAADATSCAIYARYSSHAQRDVSIEEQVAACRAWAEAKGLFVSAVYEDRAVSATSDARPRFQRMVKDAESGAFGTVVVYKLDRFARDRYDAAVYRKRLDRLGVRLESAMETIPEGPEGVILEAVIDAMAEYYSKNLAQNVMRGMLDNAGKCLANGPRPYGYERGEDGRWAVRADEAEVVRGAYARRLAGETNTEIMGWLADVGARTVRGNPFDRNAVWRMLGLECYKGVYAWGGVRVEGGMPAIVDEATWDAAQRRAPAKTPRHNRYALAGKLFDLATGKGYRGEAGTSCTGRSYLYYSVVDEDGSVRRYPKDVVEGAVTSALRGLVAEPGVARAVAKAAVISMEEGREGAALRAARAKLDEARRAEANILRAAEAGVYGAGTPARLAELRAEQERQGARVAELTSAAPSVDEMERWVRSRLCEQEPLRLLRAAVGRCAIDRAGKVHVEIPWMRAEKGLEIAPENEKIPRETPARGQFARVIFGSPYQIRTGDLRLERAAS